MATFFQDLRFALRNLRKTPALLLAAIVTLGLGIGATTAIFSTVNAVLLRPLPYPDSRDLYSLRTALTDGRPTTGMVAASEIVPLNGNASLSIERAAGLQQFPATLLRDDKTPVNVQVIAVAEGFFELFGLPMTKGGFTPEHYVANGPPNAAVISVRLWRDLYASDPDVVGKPLRFAELTTTVVGVAPRDFDTPHDADIWLGGRLNPQDVNHSWQGFIRVKPGTTQPRLDSQLTAVMAEVARQFPESTRSRIFVTRPLVDSIVGDLGPILIVVLSATALLLVLACVNVTNLLLARGAARAREMAVRVALGASRGRIVRQLLTESVLLAAAGALVGVFIASLGVRMLLAIGAAQLPRLDSVPFDGRVLAFALGALFVSGILVGFAPALRLARTDVKTLMNESGRGGSGGRATSRWLGAMTVAEIALAVTLVAGAGWLIKSFASLRAIDPGFSADQRLLFDLSPQGPRFSDPAKATASFAELFGRIRALPGVVAAGGTSSFPLRGTQENSLFAAIDGQPVDPAKPLGTRQRFVTPEFFRAMNIELQAGRDFTGDDRPDTMRVVVVNRTFANRYLSGRDPLGVRFAAGYPNINPNTMATIVGVVEDVRQQTLVEPAQPAFYSPLGQGFFFRLTVVVHSRVADTAALQIAIRDEMRKFEPLAAVDFISAADIVRTTLRRQELGMTLMLLFGAVAVVLAAVGVIGVVAYAAAERRNEVATRLALGATSLTIFWLILKRGGALAVAGAVIGLGLAYLAGRVVANNVYAVQAYDPAILSGATTLVLVIALLATTIPAIRAARLDPVRVLRPE